MPRHLRIAILLLPLCVGGCASWVLHPAGRVGEQDRIILLDSLAVMLAIVVPTILITLAFAYWYRAGNRRARYLPNFSYSGRLELLVWSVPTLVILFLGGIIWTGAHDLDPARPLGEKPLDIDVVAMDWKWLFVYPEQNIASINAITVPVGRPLRFHITSASVFNSFFIPRLGSQIYAMPGMESQLNLVADQPGRFHGLSAQFSGDGFSRMGFELDAVPAAQFATWVEKSRHSPRTLDDTSYRGLLGQSRGMAPQVYRAVMPGLFQAVVTQGQPRGKGPAAGDPARAMHPSSRGTMGGP